MLWSRCYRSADSRHQVDRANSKEPSSLGLRTLQERQLSEATLAGRLSERFLVFYSGALTLACCALVLCGFAGGRQKTSFDEVTVHRINIVEPDGTPRMILSNEDARPGSFFKGKEHLRPDRKGAGVYFYNNEGTEAGGLIYGSFIDKDGTIGEANVHLSFDQYDQDQIFAVDAGQERSGKFSMLRLMTLMMLPSTNVWKRPRGSRISQRQDGKPLGKNSIQSMYRFGREFYWDASKTNQQLYSSKIPRATIVLS
jgi:hypothetical protein